MNSAYQPLYDKYDTLKDKDVKEKMMLDFMLSLSKEDLPEFILSPWRDMVNDVEKGNYSKKAKIHLMQIMDEISVKLQQLKS